MGLYLGIFTLLTTLLVIFFNKLFNKIFNNYYLIASLGIIFFIYFWIIRYQEDLLNFINNTANVNGVFNPSLNSSKKNGIDVSKAFLLDLCPFIALLLSFGLVFDRQRNFLKIIAPYAFFGGAITIFGQIINLNLGDSTNFYRVTNPWDFIFGNEAYFLMHYYSIIISSIILMNSKGFGMKSILSTIIFPLIYFGYVMLIVTFFNVKQNATGLVEYDWLYGQYHLVYKIFGSIPFPYITILCFSLVAVYIFLWIFLRNVLIFQNRWKHSKMIAFPQISIPIWILVGKINQSISNI